MRRTVASVLIVATTLAYLASGASVAYSEAVPAEIVGVREAAAELQQERQATEAQTMANEATQQRTAMVTASATRPSISVTRGNHLSIASIGLVAPIVNVGVTATNNIDVPAGKQVGYWTGSATPGTSGAVFLDGHVDGVFASLQRVSVGQTFSMIYSGQTLAYRVVHKEVVDLAGIDMNRALSVYGGAAEGLNIMTCAGNFVPSMDTYDKRLVVYTHRI